MGYYNIKTWDNNQPVNPFGNSGYAGNVGSTSPLMMGPDYYGMPGSPGFQPVYSPYMDLTPQVQDKLNGIDTSGLNSSVDAFRDMAMRQGPSAWALLADQQQNALMNNELERGANTSNAETAQAMDQLAMTGGLSSGARERAAEAGGTNRMNMTQNASRQNNLNQMQIGINDEQNKMQEMGMLPGMEEQALQPQFQKENIWQNAAQNNVNNTMKENETVNQFNQNLYDQRMQAWAANQQANATQSSGKK